MNRIFQCFVLVVIIGFPLSATAKLIHSQLNDVVESYSRGEIDIRVAVHLIQDVAPIIDGFDDLLDVYSPDCLPLYVVLSMRLPHNYTLNNADGVSDLIESQEAESRDFGLFLLRWVDEPTPRILSTCNSILLSDSCRDMRHLFDSLARRDERWSQLTDPIIAALKGMTSVASEISVSPHRDCKSALAAVIALAFISKDPETTLFVLAHDVDPGVSSFTIYGMMHIYNSDFSPLALGESDIVELINYATSRLNAETLPAVVRFSAAFEDVHLKEMLFLEKRVLELFEESDSVEQQLVDSIYLLLKDNDVCRDRFCKILKERIHEYEKERNNKYETKYLTDSLLDCLALTH